tara:strand:- start:4663 stop:5616 length:954 start_codon:yes stop_codon:yes gene_type:complete
MYKTLSTWTEGQIPKPKGLFQLNVFPDDHQIQISSLLDHLLNNIEGIDNSEVAYINVLKTCEAYLYMFQPLVQISDHSKETIFNRLKLKGVTDCLKTKKPAGFMVYDFESNIYEIYADNERVYQPETLHHLFVNLKRVGCTTLEFDALLHFLKYTIKTDMICLDSLNNLPEGMSVENLLPLFPPHFFKLEIPNFDSFNDKTSSQIDDVFKLLFDEDKSKYLLIGATYLRNNPINLTHYVLRLVTNTFCDQFPRDFKDVRYDPISFEAFHGQSWTILSSFLSHFFNKAQIKSHHLTPGFKLMLPEDLFDQPCGVCMLS